MTVSNRGRSGISSHLTLEEIRRLRVAKVQARRVLRRDIVEANAENYRAIVRATKEERLRLAEERRRLTAQRAKERAAKALQRQQLLSKERRRLHRRKVRNNFSQVNRIRQALVMRNAGSTYAKIGEYLGVTRERARQIVASAENRLGRLLIDTSLADLVAETTALIHKREESNK